MKVFYKTIITVLIVFPLSVSSIICCCLKEALAAAEGHSATCHEHTNKSNPGHKSHQSHECQCLKVLSDKTNNDFAVRLTSSHYYEAFLKEGKMSVRFFNDALLNNTSLFTDRPPPILASAPIPIYLKIFFLRI